MKILNFEFYYKSYESVLLLSQDPKQTLRGRVVYLNQMMFGQRAHNITLCFLIFAMINKGRHFTIFCHQTRWSHSCWRHSSTSLQTQNGLLCQRPGNESESTDIITSKILLRIPPLMLVQRRELTVDSPNTLSFFSWLLCSIFPPPRHLHSIPRASIAGLTFSNMWSVNNSSQDPQYDLVAAESNMQVVWNLQM